MELTVAENLQSGADGIAAKEAVLKEVGWKLNPQERVELTAEIDSLKRQRDLDRDRAIHMTLRAYGLVRTDAATGALVMPEGKLVMTSPIKGQDIHWIAIAGDNEGRWVLNQKGEAVHIPPFRSPTGKGSSAFTVVDGVTTLLEPAFQTPGLLAMTLLHEQTHFNQYITAEMSYAEREIAALETEEKNFESIGLSPVEEEAVRRHLYGNPKTGDKGELARWREILLEERAAHLKSPIWGSGKDDPGLVLHSSGENEELGKRFDELDAVVAGELQRTRDEAARQAAEDAHRRQEESARAATRASLRATLAALTNQCGFQPVFGPPGADVFWSEAEPGNVIKGYVNKSSPLDAYTFPTAQTWDDLKVTLMLTRSCSIVDPNVDGTNETVAPPCNEGVDILNAHAHDQAFLDRISAEVTMKDGTGFGSPNRHYTYNCVADKLKQFRFPLTVKKYQKAFEAQAERNARIRKEKEKARDRESEDPDRSYRRIPRERPQRPSDPCRDNGNIRCP
jgi:hypothetical protein